MADLFQLTSKDSFYMELMNSEDPFFKERRKHVEKLWDHFQKYAEKGFIKNFANKPMQRYWEMAIGCLVLDCQLKLSSNWTKRPSPEGLDLLVEDVEGKRLWIECVTCGTSEWDTKEENQKNLVPTLENYNEKLTFEDSIDDGLTGKHSSYVGGQHLKQLKLRIANSFSEKIKQIQKCINLPKNPACQDDYFIIAIGGGEIPTHIWHDNLANETDIASLFAPQKGLRLIALDGTSELEIEENTFKANNSPVEKPFEQNGSDQVSAVLFSTRTLNSNSYHWQYDFYLINNYNAKNPLPEDLFKSQCKQINLKRKGSSLILNPSK